jgi:hypothetical protein
METVSIAGIEVSRFILGSNPFSGFSHQGTEMDRRMKHYYTVERIKQTIREAEGLGVSTVIARTDFHVMRMWTEYWDQGGKAQWFAQTCPEVGDHQQCVNRAASGGARGCHIHGGVMDYLLARDKLAEVPGVIAAIRERGMAAGIAGHDRRVFLWARENLDVDYFMCCHCSRNAEHVSGADEAYLEEDRAAMMDVITTLPSPVIHYKIMAAGRNDPEQAFAFAARHMRPRDAVCVGVYTEGNPGMLRQNVDLLHKHLAARLLPQDA